MIDKNSKSFQAAQIIWTCWINGETIKSLPDTLRPETRQQGYAIQAHFEQFSKYPLFGWKIAATSSSGQNHIRVSGPMAGRLFQERVFQQGAELKFGANRMAVAEPEFAFQMGKTLQPRNNVYSQEEVISAVNTLHPAIEIPDSRFQDFADVGEANLIADNACAHEFIFGPPMPDCWRAMDLREHSVKISVLHGPTHHGQGSNVLGGPGLALTWLVNELSKNGQSLNAGETVTTGTCAPPIPVKIGDTVNADYGVLGELTLRFARQ